MPFPTPLHPRTSALCTSYAWKEWAGFHAVRFYDGSHEPEYMALRHAAGLLDVSPLFKYEVSGPDAGAFLSFVMSRDVSRLKPGRVTYCCLCSPAGKVIDDGTVARLEESRYRTTTASPALRWLSRHSRGFDVTVEDVSERLAALAVQGPTSTAVLDGVLDRPLAELPYFGIASRVLAGVPVEVSRTGYTGDLGYEIWIPAGDALAVWDALIEEGTRHGLLPVGLDALDVTRLEAGFILQGVDYFNALLTPVDSRRSSPFEIGLDWTVKLDRAPFIGQKALRAEVDAGPRWALVGLEMDWPELEALYEAEGLPPHLPAAAWRTPVPVHDGRHQVGQATSGTWSPLLKRNIALASVEAPLARPGTRLRMEHTVEFRRHLVTATVVDRPFFDPERKRA